MFLHFAPRFGVTAARRIEHAILICRKVLIHVTVTLRAVASSRLRPCAGAGLSLPLPAGRDRYSVRCASRTMHATVLPSPRPHASSRFVLATSSAGSAVLTPSVWFRPCRRLIRRDDAGHVQAIHPREDRDEKSAQASTCRPIGGVSAQAGGKKTTASARISQGRRQRHVGERVPPVVAFHTVNPTASAKKW
jgi:hypothetical protein